MIAPRWERRGLRAARPVLVVGMAPSRAGHDLDGPTFDRLAAYAGRSLERVDFVNLLPSWPGEADSPKWDAAPDHRGWDVGGRASLLYADLLERPRRRVIGLGDFVRKALTHWWRLEERGRLDPFPGPASAGLAWSPHPAGTNMWWNDPANRAAGEAFWQSAARASAGMPLPPRKVQLSTRTKWLLNTLASLELPWPDGCLDWPFVDPPGRPQALLRGGAVPASRVALEMAGFPRPTAQHQALHSCDRGDHCVSPGHLRWGTELENRLDQVSRGRGSIGKVGMEGAEEIVRQFSDLAEDLAARYGVSTSAIWGIASGRSWGAEKWTEETEAK